MNIKEKVQRFMDEQRLKKEINLAKKEISEASEKLKDNLEEKIKNDEKIKEDSKIFKFNSQKLKDIGLIAVAVMLIGAGYVNFSNNETSENVVLETASEDSNSLGDVQLVSSESGLVENDDEATENNESDIVDETSEEIEEVEETVSSESSTSEYFAELKLNRDNIYSEKLEAYQQIVDSSSISSEQKAIAIQEIEEITNTQNSIQVAEELIKLKGFENVVIYVNGDSVNVIVRAAALSTEQVAQIQNIVSRELSAEVRKYQHFK